MENIEIVLWTAFVTAVIVFMGAYHLGHAHGQLQEIERKPYLKR